MIDDSVEAHPASGAARAWVRGLPAALERVTASLAVTDAEAEALVDAACRRHGLDCPRCGADDPYEFGAGRLRCRACRKGYGLRTGRWLARCRMPARDWVVLMRSFVWLSQYRELAQMSRLALRTVFVAVTALRESLVAADEAWAGVGGKAADADARQAFAVTRGERSVRVTPVIREGLALRSEDLVHRNGFLYLDGVPGYHAVVLHGSQSDERLSGGPLDRPRAGDPFLAFLLERAVSMRGMRAESFPYYLKEWECRFNMGPEEFFRHMLDCVTRRAARPAEAAEWTTR